MSTTMTVTKAKSLGRSVNPQVVITDAIYASYTKSACCNKLLKHDHKRCMLKIRSERARERLRCVREAHTTPKFRVSLKIQ